MIYTYKNFAEGKLAAEMSAVATSFTVTPAHSLPTTGTFIAVIWNAELYADPGKDPDVEICLAEFDSGYTFNVTRAQESTAAVEHIAGSTVGLYLTAAAFADLVGPKGDKGDTGDPAPFGYQEYTTGSGNWTCPTGVTQITVTMIGGGGGGGYGASASGGAGGASSGGFITFNLKVTPGNTYAYSIGAAGTGATSNGNGTNGGATSFAGISAKGGTKGPDYSGAATYGGILLPTGNQVGFGNNGMPRNGMTGGDGGGSPWGAGGVGSGGDGSGYGAGGAGGGGNFDPDGGDGVGGYILITW